MRYSVVSVATDRELQQHPTSSSPHLTMTNPLELQLSDYTGRSDVARYCNHLELHLESMRDLGSFILKWFISKRRVSD